MNTSLSVADVTDARWEAFVRAHPDATPFHDPAWARVLSESYGCSARAILLLNSSGEVLAGMPFVESRRRRAWVTLPFTDQCSPLITEECTEAAFVGRLDMFRIAAGVRTVEIRGPMSGQGVRPGASSLVHELVIPREEVALRKTYSSHLRRNLARAERSGVVVRRGTRETDLTRVFYGLHVLTRHRLGVPVQPRRYFENLWRRMLAEEKGFVLIAEHEGRPVAAVVFLVSNGHLIYKYSASDDSLRDLRGTYAIVSEALRWACVDGCTSLNFGRTATADVGLSRFKRQWGAAESPLTYSVLADRNPEVSRVELSPRIRALFRRSPPIAVRVAGSALYKHMI